MNKWEETFEDKIYVTNNYQHMELVKENLNNLLQKYLGYMFSDDFKEVNGHFIPIPGPLAKLKVIIKCKSGCVQIKTKRTKKCWGFFTGD